MGKELPDVRPGQIWADNDHRSAGRRVKVLEVVDFAGEPTAVVQVISPAVSGIKINPAKPRITKVKVRRFKPNSTGYRLERDAG